MEDWSQFITSFLYDNNLKSKLTLADINCLTVILACLINFGQFRFKSGYQSMFFDPPKLQAQSQCEYSAAPEGVVFLSEGLREIVRL